SGLTVIVRIFPRGNALHEVGQFRLECLGAVQLRRPHIAGAVVHQQVIKTLARADVDALVVDLDLFVGLHVVPDQHFFLSADQRGADFYRREPVDVDVRDDFVGKINRHVGDIFVAVQVGLACGHDGLRTFLDEMVNYGKIVRGQVPHDIHVMLKKSQVYARGIVVINLAQRAAVEEFADFFHRSGKQEGVVHHDAQVLLCRQFNEFVRLLGATGKGLFHENMLAVFERRFGQFVVGPDWGDDRDRVNVGGGHEFRGVRRDANIRMSFLYFLPRSGALVADRDHRGTLQLIEVADYIGTPISVAYDSKLNHKFTLRLEAVITGDWLDNAIGK